jgi:Tfp pilus assembly protein PilO
MDLNNIKIDDFKEKIDDLKEKILKAEKPTLIKFGIGFGALILLLVAYLTIIKPIIDKKKMINEDQILKLDEILKFKKDIKSYKKKIKQITPDYKKNSSLFHSKEEVEDLYNTLSIFATANNLEILKIEKKTPEPISGSKKTDDKKKKSLKAKNVSYYKIPVSYEIYGSFLDFIKFKRAIAKSKKMLNFEKELIKISDQQSGKVNVVGELTIVGLPNEFN